MCCSSQERYKSNCLHGYHLEIKPKNKFLLIILYDTQTDMYINALIYYMYYMYMPYNPYIQRIHCKTKEYSQ